MTARTKMFAGALATGVVLAMPVAAYAQSDDYVREPTEVRGETQVRPTRVEGTTVARSAESGALAVTGGDIVGLLAIGAGAVGVGSVLLRRGRTRSSAA